MTINGVEYNFDITPYTYAQKYPNFKLLYKFSSQLYLNKFLTYLFNEKQSNICKKKFGLNVDLHLLERIKEYSLTEKRGFRIIKISNDEVKEYNSLKDIKIIPSFDIK